MSLSLNKIILGGYLARDPEIRYTQSGNSVTKFTLAVNNPRNKEEAVFVDILAWECLGETCNTYLRKGSGAIVEGRLTIRSFDDNESVRRKATEVVIDAMQMLSTPTDGKDGSNSRYAAQKDAERSAHRNGSSATHPSAYRRSTTTTSRSRSRS